ncbi:MAG: hypothetical protein IT320_03090 [Anaerolineae bacterium]|nr:hypothetical protein [Anaerolineae bacterium]
MTERKKHEDDPDAWLKDYPAYFDPAYRDDIAENKEGRLSARQKPQVLTWEYRLSPDEERKILQSLEQVRVPNSGQSVILFVFAGLLLLIALAAPFNVVYYGAALLAWVAALGSIGPQPLASDEIRSRYLAEKARRHDNLAWMASQRKVIRVEGTPTYDHLYAVTVDGVAYSVEPPLYRWLRTYCSRVAVYAIEGWYPQHALSVEPLDVPIPLTPEERLQRVVGVNSEGELVYADDPPSEDARRIDRP